MAGPRGPGRSRDRARARDRSEAPLRATGVGGRRLRAAGFESDFSHAFGVGPERSQPSKYQDGESFGLSVFLRDREDVYRTYFTSGRGVEALGSVWTFLDLTPLGRQEEWEDSPEGYPQTPPYAWWRRHDEYGR